MATAAAANGLYYYEYTLNPYSVSEPGAIIDPSRYQDDNYYTSGSVQDLDSLVPSTEDTFVVVAQGFFYAQTAGAYIFSSPNVDDNLYFWAGGALGTGQAPWSVTNANYQAHYPTTGAATLVLQAGELVPVSILWGNAGGPGALTFDITTPDGQTHMDTTGFFVLPCIDQDFQP